MFTCKDDVLHNFFESISLSLMKSAYACTKRYTPDLKGLLFSLYKSLCRGIIPVPLQGIQEINDLEYYNVYFENPDGNTNFKTKQNNAKIKIRN